VQGAERPARFGHAQGIVTHRIRAASACSARRVGDEGGGFGSAHDAQVSQAALTDDPHERVTAVRTLIAEETRLGMLVGVAVGLELAHELLQQTLDDGEDPPT
jgi:hypothetical protein